MPSTGEALSLLAALVLPWLGGAAALVCLRLPAGPGYLARIVGYGFFLGYAAVFLLVHAVDALSPALHFSLLFAVVATLSLAALVLAYRRGLPPNARHSCGPDAPPLRWLCWLLAAGAALHLVLAATEILYRPVFPWDAWLNWMYRAKAWFLADAVLPMDDPRSWARGAALQRFNVEASHYPSFVPVIALWPALALGRWSETLVNLPVLGLGAASALALYGQVRALPLPRCAAALCAYLLLSIPLVGVHLSLAGQADIWMAGYVGTGFVALIGALIERRRSELLLALAMIAVGVFIKEEGKVWLIVALLLPLYARWPGQLVLATALGAGAAVLAVSTGSPLLDLPLLGPLGVTEGRLFVPMLGSYALETRLPLTAFWENYIEGASWHLLWPSLLVLLPVLAVALRGRTRNVLAAFLALTLGSLFFIFSFTDQGRWAEDATAINRLPLHFVPAFVYLFAVAAASSARLAPVIRVDGPRAVIAGLAALAIVTAAVLAHIAAGHPVRAGQPVRVAPESLAVRVGAGYLGDGSRIVSGFDGRIAVVSSRDVRLDAGSYPLLHLRTSGENRKLVEFFWRRADDPETLHALTVDGRGSRWRELAHDAAWRGAITEVGLLLYEGGGEGIAVDGLELWPDSLGSEFLRLFGNWSEHTPWTFRAVNRVAAGSPLSPVPLPLVVTTWLLLAAALALWICRRRRTSPLPLLLAFALTGWLVLDLRWLAERVAQARNTVDDYPLVTAAYLRFADDRLVRRLVARAAADAGEAPLPIVLASLAHERHQVELRRAKYHALPRPAYVHDGPLQRLPRAVRGQLLLLKEWYGQPGPESDASAVLPVLVERLGTGVRIVWESRDAALLQIQP